MRPAIAILVLLPLRVVAWLAAHVQRRWLSQEKRVRETLAALGLGPLIAGREIAVRRIGKGHMNAVLAVSFDDRALVLKHMLGMGTLSRTVREVLALRFLRRHRVPAPKVLGYDVRRRVIALSWIDGVDLSTRLDDRAADLGRLLARMHALGLAMGDVKPIHFVLDRDERIVPVDLGEAHLRATPAQCAFDLACACAFLHDGLSRARLLEAYDSARAHRNQKARTGDLVDADVDVDIVGLAHQTIREHILDRTLGDGAAIAQQQQTVAIRRR
jgi:hypothetical protein